MLGIPMTTTVHLTVQVYPLSELVTILSSYTVFGWYWFGSMDYLPN